MTISPRWKYQAAVKQWSYDHETGEIVNVQSGSVPFKNKYGTKFIKVRVGSKTVKMSAKKFAFYSYHGCLPPDREVTFREGESLAIDNLYLKPIEGYLE